MMVPPAKTLRWNPIPHRRVREKALCADTHRVSLIQANRSRRGQPEAVRIVLRDLAADRVMQAAIVVLLLPVLWLSVPVAVGAVSSRDTLVEVDVLPALAVAPGYRTGKTSVALPVQTLPGEDKTASSDGWNVSSTWYGGYGVTIRSATSPALKGANAVDGAGASGDSFSDFTTSGCPCPWSAAGFDRGVFGYSASVGTKSGVAGEAAKWGSSSAKRWRGLTRTEYGIVDSGGIGEFDVELHFRTQIPETATQSAGSYRANIIVGIRPLITTGNRLTAGSGN
jgi:hypothetical protein